MRWKYAFNVRSQGSSLLRVLQRVSRVKSAPKDLHRLVWILLQILFAAESALLGAYVCVQILFCSPAMKNPQQISPL